MFMQREIQTFRVWGLAAIACAGFLAILLARIPAISALLRDAALFTDRLEERFAVAGSPLIRLDLLPPEAATICEHVNQHGIARFFVDRGLYEHNNHILHRTVEGCWPKRVAADAVDGFVPAGSADKWLHCKQTPLANGVVHVVCAR